MKRHSGRPALPVVSNKHANTFMITCFHHMVGNLYVLLSHYQRLHELDAQVRRKMGVGCSILELFSGSPWRLESHLTVFDLSR